MGGVILFAIIAFSIITVMYVLQYMVLSDHDYLIPYLRTYWEPQRGRYFASSLNRFFIVDLPVLSGIHPNDLNTSVTAFIKALIISMTCFAFAQSAFLSREKKYNFLSPGFILLYAVLFLCTFNNNYLCNGARVYFLTFENTVFFEYGAALLPYAIFWNIFGNRFICNKDISKQLLPVIAILVLILSTSVEITNFPALYSLFVFGILYLFKKNKTRSEIMTGITISITYILGLSAYYFNEQRDLNIDYFNLYYVKSQFFMFCDIFFNSFIPRNSQILISPIAIILILVVYYIFNRKDDKTKRFLIFVSVNIACIFIFYFSTFFLAGNDGAGPGNYPLNYLKWHCIFRLTCVYWLTVTAGYIIALTLKSEKKFQTGIIILCITVLLIFKNNLILNYVSAVKREIAISKEDRISMYKTEKEFLNAVEEGRKEIYITGKYLNNMQQSTHEILPPLYWLLIHYQNCYGNFAAGSDTIIFDEKKEENPNLFTTEELKELRFTGMYKKFKDK